MISVAVKAARSVPRSDPAKSQDFLPKAKPRKAAPRRFSSVKSGRHRGMTASHANACACSRLPRRMENCETTLLSPFEPVAQFTDDRLTVSAAALQTLIGRKPVYIPLDIEQGVDLFDGFERHSARQHSRGRPVIKMLAVRRPFLPRNEQRIVNACSLRTCAGPFSTRVFPKTF